MKSHSLRAIPGILALALAASSGACRKNDAPVQAPPPAEVSVIAVASENLAQTSELPGRIQPVREAQVRARATGILLKRLFVEGADVREGQVLFEIDPAPLQASLAVAKAALAKAEAAFRESGARAARYAELVKINAVSRQVHDEAAATAGQNEADVLSAKAAVQTAELNLGYTRVVAPINGRIGKALVTEGALVSAGEATQLAVIRQLDPVYFDFTQSSTEVLHLRRALEKGTLQGAGPGLAGLSIVLEDGTPYAHGGKLLFSDVAVDPTTGMITLRAEIPNPEGILMPGMFARARIVEGMTTNALVVPQRTVARGAAGASTVLVVNDRNQVEVRPITIDRTVGTKVIVASGLKAGERVIVEGSQKARSGEVVKPVPYVPPGAVPGNAGASAKTH